MDDSFPVKKTRAALERRIPLFNIEEPVLQRGLEIMDDAIHHVEKHGHSEGDAVAFPSGVAGFQSIV